MAKPLIDPETKEKLTPDEYVLRVSDMIDAFDCEYGHLACAAWDRGPCSNEVLPEDEESWL